MCEADKAALTVLQGQVKALEKERDDAKTALKAEQDKTAAFQEAEMEALEEAVTAKLPEGRTLKELVGETPTKAALAACLNTLQATAPQEPAGEPQKAGLGSGGRKTAATPRDTGRQPALEMSADTRKAKEDYLKAQRARLGLPEKSTLPIQMQRKVGGLALAAAPVEAGQKQ